MHIENCRLRRQAKKSSFGFGMVSAMLLLVLVALLTTWIGVALTDQGRRMKGERIGVEIIALRDLMQTFVDLHGAEIKEAYVKASDGGAISVPITLQNGQKKSVSATKQGDYMMLDPAQIVEVAAALNWRNHVQLHSGNENANYNVRIRASEGNNACNKSNEDKCTLQILVYRHTPLTFLKAPDRVAVQSAVATIGRGGGAAVSLGNSEDATHFSFSGHAQPADTRSSAFLSNPTKQPGAIAALSDRASTYQPFLRRDGGSLDVDLNMNSRDIKNVQAISVDGRIVASRGLEIGNEEKAMRFTPGALSSAGNFNVESPNFTISSPGSSDVISVTEGRLHAKELTAESLSSKKPVRFHEIATLGGSCINAQISFTKSGEPAYCKGSRWEPFVKKTETEQKGSREVKEFLPGIKPPREWTRDPLFKEGIAKWVTYSAVLTFPPTYRDDRSVFFIGSEWTHCEVVDPARPKVLDQSPETSRIAGFLRSKFQVDTQYNEEIYRLGNEVTWQFIVLRPSPISQLSHTYKVTCHRAALMDANNQWHMAKLSPIAHPYSFEHATPNRYSHQNFHRIERLTLTRDPGQ